MTEEPIISCEKCKYTCRRLLTADFLVMGERDVADYNDIRKNPPKYLRFKDGHRERYDPSKHGTRKGAGSYTKKKDKK